jgi:ubiquinone/menaquinone biosynthesis C-methylase UbiE
MGTSKIRLGSLLSAHRGAMTGPRVIHACSTGMHHHIHPGDRTLFTGAGGGADAVEAAERGSRVTVVDISGARLEAFSRTIRGRSFLFPVELVLADIFTFEDAQGYDLVFANFFLDRFPRIMVLPLVEHLAGLLKRRGCLVVGDFAPPTGNPAVRVMGYAYWYFTDIFHHLVARSAIHPIYDYQEMLERLDFTIEDRKYYHIYLIGRFLSVLAARH